MVGFIDIISTLATYFFVVPLLFIFLVLLAFASIVIVMINMHSSEEFEVFPDLSKNQ